MKNYCYYDFFSILKFIFDVVIIMASDNSYNGPKWVFPPNEENIQNPFFAYGIFKPGQIEFSEIEDYI